MLGLGDRHKAFGDSSVFSSLCLERCCSAGHYHNGWLFKPGEINPAGCLELGRLASGVGNDAQAHASS